MAMGAFLAGVLLSESSFRHQLEADIEPFRGILLGLFFLAVGMSLDLGMIAREWRLVGLAVVAFMCVKAFGIFLVAKLFRSKTREAVTRVALFSQGGEFAFVLYSAALSVGVFDAQVNAVASATIILSMALTPLLVLALDRWLPPEETSLDGVEVADGLDGRALMIGFGRFGQVVEPVAARARLQRLDHRDRCRADQGGVGFRLQGPLWRRHAPGNPARIWSRPRGSDPDLRRQPDHREQDRRGRAGAFPARQAVRARL